MQAGDTKKLHELAERRSRRGLATPIADNAPELYPELVPVWNAFQFLFGDRVVSMGYIGPIPVTAYEAYFNLFGPREIEERNDFLALLMRLDEVFLDHVLRENEKNRRVLKENEKNRRETAAKAKPPAKSKS